MAFPPGRLAGLIVGIAAMAAPAMAQDEPRFALVASLPTPTVSLQWELSEKFALRFEGSYVFREESLDLPIDSSVFGASEHVYADGTSSPVVIWGTSLVVAGVQSASTTHSGSIGVAGIWTMYRTDRLRLYAAPRISLAWSRERFTSTLPAHQTLSGRPPESPFTATLEESRTSPGAGASFGAATNVHRHVALFGEAGISYSRGDSRSPGTIGITLGDSESKNTAVSTRAIAGVMLLF